MSRRPPSLADIYAILLREPFHLSRDDLRNLTDRQIVEVYFRPKFEEEGQPDDLEPKSEDEVREWCAMTAAAMGIPEDKAAEWIEKAVASWRSEQNGQGAGGETGAG